jgi:hypothetical protein
MVGIVAALSVSASLTVACSGEATPSPAAEPPSIGAVASTTATTLGASLQPTGSSADSTAPGTSAPALRQVPSVVCCRGQTLEAGRYEVPPWLGIPMSVDAPEGWRVLNEGRARLFMLGRGENVQGNPDQMIVFLDASGEETPEATIEGVREAEQLVALDEATEVTIAGFPGVQLDSSVLPNPAFEGDPEADIPPGVQFLPVIEQYFAPGFVWTTSSPEARVRTIALTVGDRTLLVYLEAPSSEFGRFADDVATILESLEPVSP